MENEDFLKALRAGKIDPVYLFLGPAALLMGEAWNKLLAALLPKDVGRFNGERLQARETDPSDLIARLAVIPMFGGRRTIMVENVEAWGKAPLSAVENFVPRIPSSACLVLTASGRKSIEALARAVEAKGKIVTFRSPGEREAPRWLIERARQMGKNLSPKAAFLLVETAGTDLQTLASELDKICTFAGDKDSIEPEDILEAAGSHRTFSAFDLLDHIKARQADKALLALRSLVLAGEQPLKILSTLAWQIRIVWQVKDGLRQSIPESQLAKRVGAHPFVVKKAGEQAARFSDAYLYRVMEAVGRTDIAMKSTGTSPVLLLEDLVLNLARTD
ncbi:MAG: DNA polymerase III subunit delta [Syntrophobacteraceae bacterium]|nr:DNA polymerase III subunit delta [Syntrophobacteraceae bacterium]